MKRQGVLTKESEGRSEVYLQCLTLTVHITDYIDGRAYVGYETVNVTLVP